MRVYSYIPSTKALGPYERFALWVAGCPFRCQNCMTKDAQPLDSGYEISEFEIANTINKEIKNEGITITGGEPFLQAKELNSILELISKDLGVIIYTGFTKKELIEKNCYEINKLLKRVDILIDGQFKDELNNNDSLRGSSNQNIYQLTTRYSKVFDSYYKHKKREVEIYLESEEMMVVGIPSIKTLDKINNLGVKI